MSARAPSSLLVLLGCSVALVAVLVLAALVGLWLGGRTADLEPSLADSTSKSPANHGGPNGNASYEAPVFLDIGAASGIDVEAVADEVRLARAVGVRQFVVSIVPPWPGGEPNLSLLDEPVQAVLGEAPEASLWLRVRMDPPVDWLARNPRAAVHVDGAPQAVFSIASREWLDASREALDALTEHVAESGWTVDGYILEGLESGRWRRTGPRDNGPAATEAFQNWLRTRYESEDALRESWGVRDLTFGAVEIPVRPDTSDTARVFYSHADHSQQDFKRFITDVTGRALDALARHLAGAAPESEIYLAYGDILEDIPADSGHLALETVLEGAAAGLVSPVSNHDRGLGGVGGFAGPIDSAKRRGKSWALVEDTRTGVARDPATGQPSRMPGLRAEDVLAVQQRNFAAALAHDLPLLFSDPQGLGALLDEDMWEQFEATARAYESVYSQAPDGDIPPIADEPTLCVVVDTASRFVQQCESPLNRRLLLGARDAALQAGVPAQYCLLDDLFGANPPDAKVYLFLNAFQLAPDRRNALHSFLGRRQAAAVWMYAPGYFGPAPSVANVSGTTRFETGVYDEPGQSGSVYTLNGRHIQEGEVFGQSEQWQPLFYIDEEPVETAEGNLTLAVLAHYTQTERASVAMRFLDEGWASIYVAEPTLTPALLRQILLILEEHVFVGAPTEGPFDVAHFGPNFMAVHARSESSAERTIELPRTCDLRDVYEPDIGWPKKRTLSVTLRMGQTRALELTPVSVRPNASPAAAGDTAQPPPE